MTQDEIIEMARQAGFVCLMPDEAMDMIGGIFEGDTNLLGNFEAFAKLVAAKEREACAIVCDVLAEDYGKAGLPMTYNGLKASSKEIRARGEA